MLDADANQPLPFFIISCLFDSPDVISDHYRAILSNSMLIQRLILLAVQPLLFSIACICNLPNLISSRENR